MIASLRFYVETCKADGYRYPAWMDGDYQIVYHSTRKAC